MHSFEVLQSCKAYRQDRAKTQALECPSPIYSEVPHRVSGCLPVFCLYPCPHALAPCDAADFAGALPPAAFHVLHSLCSCRSDCDFSSKWASRLDKRHGLRPSARFQSPETESGKWSLALIS